MQSQYETKLSDLSNFYDADVQLLVTFIEDVTQPSIDALKIKVGLMTLIKDVLDYQNTNGKTEKSNQRVKFLEGLIQRLDSLDKIATQNFNLQLAMKENYRMMEVLKAKNKELEETILNYNQQL